MPVHHFYAGEATHTVKHRRRRFRPHGAMIVRQDGASRAAEDVERLSSGGYSARLFVGLNIGDNPRWSVDDVADRVFEIRKAQNRSGDSSILLQRGTYENFAGKRVTEESVQVIIIDLAGQTKPAFVADMKDLAEKLRAALEQEVVILEIQKKGVVQDVYSATA
jgi:hypothetical protein